eukprot:CAMPEP_0181208752 /NCGR_PEP_ID=MMETSP1096-20121128/22291_1 /TAXON_ID=156174 ORGANISM="Chrysochromulina ericina, Strain CCMP281" /NCGR_SAMPLE_ID=MMETSP1096 /ASSEMBLY_ACC=CAM_ASM_000453 /LENGTH=221 /DNA_ID=CAMNT_0023299849 /DNA_START=343 /DNA_END=1008 /DNA_ORIENTATION=+
MTDDRSTWPPPYPDSARREQLSPNAKQTLDADLKLRSPSGAHATVSNLLLELESVLSSEALRFSTPTLVRLFAKCSCIASLCLRRLPSRRVISRSWEALKTHSGTPHGNCMNAHSYGRMMVFAMPPSSSTSVEVSSVRTKVCVVSPKRASSEAKPVGGVLLMRNDVAALATDDRLKDDHEDDEANRHSQVRGLHLHAIHHEEEIHQDEEYGAEYDLKEVIG